MKKYPKENFKILPGKPYPFGATFRENGINFALVAKDSHTCTLCLFEENHHKKPYQEFELDPAIHKTGEVWHIFLRDVPSLIVYGYRITSQNGQTYLLHDPYAPLIDSHKTWGENRDKPYHPLGKVVSNSQFNWEGDKFPKIPMHDLVIYEMHVRGFTRHESSEAKYPGTYLGLVEKIAYLKKLGINAVELMPIYEFNENEAVQVNPATDEKLYNYFGYSTVNFFAPMNRYAFHSNHDNPLNEFKMMIRELHKNDIEVILDVVYNHTAEGNERGPVYSYKGLNLRAYYMMDDHGNFLNFSGCGNTFNGNHIIVQELIIQSLRYWVTEMHVDGFRFDLASIHTRDENGTPLAKAPLIEAISKDPILAHTKLISEAWDAAGLYQVGGFYPGTRWAEWNGRYRDTVRNFIKGTPGYKKMFATALCGSQDLYGWGRAPICSVNFITAHDGFSLADLVTYNQKHNEENGENNRDGFDHNDSWNCGLEGHSSNKKIVHLRERQIRNFFLALMVSQGIPMFMMGDEYAHTRHGNNNPWCQDNELNWFLWNRLEARAHFFRFCKSLIHFRKSHPLFKRENFLSDQDISWHGIELFNPDWDHNNHFLAFTLNGENGAEFYIAFNAGHTGHMVKVPLPASDKIWRWVVNTHHESPKDFYDEGNRQPLTTTTVRIHSYSAILLEAHPE